MSQHPHKLARMLKVMSLAALVATTVPALANDYTCKDEIKVTGYGAFFEGWGDRMAKWSWRNTAIAEYGIFYADESTANEGHGLTTERCAQSWFGLTICEVRGRPCVEQTELECKHKDGQACDPKIKWIQSKLADKGYPVGPIDGRNGSKFKEATKKFMNEFKKDTKIADGSSIDDVIEALKKSDQTKTASLSHF